jgi:putative membrane protein
MPITDHPWLMLKLLFVAGLYVYFFFLHKIFKQQQNNIIAFSPMALRVINEISTIFLFAIVFLVILKSIMNMVWGIIALVGFILVLMIGIKVYKNIRERAA